ncbi:MAG: TIGR03905 family TSCPD domain-containing protein [Bacteroidales bacterium]|nr:TIGR03905 family TSCPD domain-containing protein [Bacteroidales bacterium]
MKYEYIPSGTCSKKIEFEVDENGLIRSVKFAGGCNGNLKGLSAMTEGQTPESVIERLKGIECGTKGTSCPDQFARALEMAMQQ